MRPTLEPAARRRWVRAAGALHGAAVALITTGTQDLPVFLCAFAGDVVPGAGLCHPPQMRLPARLACPRRTPTFSASCSTFRSSCLTHISCCDCIIVCLSLIVRAMLLQCSHSKLSILLFANLRNLSSRAKQDSSE